ncbi:MAG: O-antigen ligase family protein [Bacteroidetes bacterium]|nr:O-antigen ligase family protein [Bacteroidota bacterium]
MKNTKRRIHQGIFRYCMLAVAFLLPVSGRYVPPFIGLMFLNWIVEGRFRQKFRLVASSRMRQFTLLFGLLYLLYLAGLIYTSNFEYGLFDLQVKLSLVVFPFLFATMDGEHFSGPRRIQLLRFYIAGCLAGSLLFMGRAFVETEFHHAINAFFYGSLSWYFHSSYLSMYYNFAVAVLLGHLITVEFRRKTVVYFAETALILWFIILVFLLSSKAGILTLGGILLFYSGLLIFKRKQLLPGIIILVLGAIIFYTTSRLLPAPFERMEYAGEVIRSDPGNKSQSTESTGERLAIWKASSEIIREHFLIGVGTGDVKDSLYGKYSENKMYPALVRKLNCHCQYLQTFIALGAAGFLVLVLMLALPAIQAVRRKDNLYLVFLGIFAFNILVESMFETQAGVMFYAFFNAFLFVSMGTADRLSAEHADPEES